MNTSKNRGYGLGSSLLAKWWLVTLSAISLVTGCLAPIDGEVHGNPDGNGTQEPPIVTGQFALQLAQSCDQVKDKYVEALVEQVLERRYSSYGWAEDGNGDTGAPPPSGGAPSYGDDAPSDFTDTNVQEKGVDEPDIIKTDGRHIYLIQGTSLRIMKSWPADQTEEIGRYDFSPETQPISLFLRNDRLAIFSRIQSAPINGTRVSIMDVTDRENPTIERHIDMGGYFINARMIQSQVYLVTNSHTHLAEGIWDWVWSDEHGLPPMEWDADAERQEALKDEARPLVADMARRHYADVDITGIFPQSSVNDMGGPAPEPAPMYDCTDIYLTRQTSQLGLLNITQIDLDNDHPAPFSSGLMANGWLVYSSQQNLYVALSSRSWWGMGNTGDESHIHKFELPPENVAPIYRATGKVDGWILNQFSMGEYQGHLRIATSDNRWRWDEETNERRDDGGNHLFVLKEDNGQLVETGAIRNLAPTERIYSARLMGPKGYLVTFFETDPLYTLDLSDPTNPQMLGELKVDGYSSYMHPMGDGFLLAIGRDGDSSGTLTGVHLQIFDVSDMTDPQRIHHEVLSTGNWSSYSEALWNHHAFTYHDGSQMLAIPINIDDNNEQFSGLILYRANKEEGFIEVGRVSHEDLRYQVYCGDQGYAEDCYNGGRFPWYTQMRRSIFMFGDQDGDEFVYSLSQAGLKVNRLFQPSSELAAIPFYVTE